MSDEDALAQRVGRLRAADQLVSLWREPDLENALTAIAVAPSHTAARLLSDLPLTLREPAMVT